MRNRKKVEWDYFTTKSAYDNTVLRAIMRLFRFNCLIGGERDMTICKNLRSFDVLQKKKKYSRPTLFDLHMIPFQFLHYTLSKTHTYERFQWLCQVNSKLQRISNLWVLLEYELSMGWLQVRNPPEFRSFVKPSIKMSLMFAAIFRKWDRSGYVYKALNEIWHALIKSK